MSLARSGFVQRRWISVQKDVKIKDQRQAEAKAFGMLSRLQRLEPSKLPIIMGPVADPPVQTIWLSPISYKKSKSFKEWSDRKIGWLVNGINSFQVGYMNGRSAAKQLEWTSHLYNSTIRIYIQMNTAVATGNFLGLGDKMSKSAMAQLQRKRARFGGDAYKLRWSMLDTEEDIFRRLKVMSRSKDLLSKNGQQVAIRIRSRQSLDVSDKSGVRMPHLSTESKLLSEYLVMHELVNDSDPTDLPRWIVARQIYEGNNSVDKPVREFEGAAFYIGKGASTAYQGIKRLLNWSRRNKVKQAEQSVG